MNTAVHLLILLPLFKWPTHPPFDCQLVAKIWFFRFPVDPRTMGARTYFLHLSTFCSENIDQLWKVMPPIHANGRRAEALVGAAQCSMLKHSFTVRSFECTLKLKLKILLVRITAFYLLFQEKAWGFSANAEVEKNQTKNLKLKFKCSWNWWQRGVQLLETIWTRLFQNVTQGRCFEKFSLFLTYNRIGVPYGHDFFTGAKN